MEPRKSVWVPFPYWDGTNPRDKASPMIRGAISPPSNTYKRNHIPSIKYIQEEPSPLHQIYTRGTISPPSKLYKPLLSHPQLVFGCSFQS